MRHYVTVAPPPSIGLDGLDRRLIYWLCYEATASRGFLPAASPDEEWWTSNERLVEAIPRANDGVVPSSSQFLPGHDVEVVLGDHADVIGHFEGDANTTPFKSGSNFTRQKHEALWKRIGALLRSAAQGDVDKKVALHPALVG
jgi:hypothetical protein